MRRHWVATAIFGIILVAGFIAIMAIRPNHRSVSQPSTTPVTAGKPIEAPKTLTGSYLMSGDVFWGRGMDYYAQRSPLKLNWPFSGLKTFHPEKYDGWISDLECPVTDKTVPYQTQVDHLVLQCPPSYLSVAKQYFTAFTIANNHTGNSGQPSFDDTRTNLAKAGIQFFGDYDLSQKANLCEVVSLPAKVGSQSVKLPIAMCGYHWLDRLPTTSELAEISTYAKYFPVWVFPHGGTEYVTGHTPEQATLYHKFIDLGADVVFGDHPHVVEDTEAYHGKLIIYNFGNLIYDQWFDNEVTKSLVMNTRVTAKVDANLEAYLKMGKRCAAFKDDCLAIAQKDSLTAYKLSYTYKPIAGDSSNANMNTRPKHLASPSVQAWLLQRLNWTKTLAGLD